MSYDFSIQSLGNTTVESPILYSQIKGDTIANYVTDSEKILYDVCVHRKVSSVHDLGLLERAGPRKQLYFLPKHVHAGIITCGGLCPGLNDVIRSLTRCLWYRYGVRRISGIRFGFSGLLPDTLAPPPIQLTPEFVNDIHKIGGSVLGSSRGGGGRTVEIVDAIERLNLNILFVIGGDGSQKGALAIADEVVKRKNKIGVVGIPKTIDNDFSFIDRSFGFETAVSEATRAVRAAYTEAHSAMRGIGLVRLMGRESGFIAAYTALASQVADFVLVPEVPFTIDGEHGLCALIQKRLTEQGHAVIIVAEGAGQNLLEGTNDRDASGNKKLADIGVHLKNKLNAYLSALNMQYTLKYIDPSYIIRSTIAVPTDEAYCARLANHAVHAAMAGKTKMIVALINGHFVHMPMTVAVSERKRIDPEESLWQDVIEATHQPLRLGYGEQI